MDACEAAKQLGEIINGSENIVFFGGAGVSTESNIPDFRSASGLYRKNAVSAGSETTAYAPEEILHNRFFHNHTRLFFDYYFENLVYPDAKPNAAHHMLAKLEHAGRLKAVVTQNVDGLHQMAGSRFVIELHGSVHQNSCTGCGMRFSLADMLQARPEIPSCTACGEVIKPDVVLYGEMLPDNAVNAAVEYIIRAEVLIVGGTSLSVYPAAGLIQYFKGKKLILINREETPYDHMADLVIRERIGEVLAVCVP